MWVKTACVVLVGVLFAACSFQTEQFVGDAALPPPEVGFARDTSLQDESSDVVEVAVRLSRPADETVEVDYSFAGGTASLGMDYEAMDGTVIFSPGETERGIQLKILPDFDETEGNETIGIVLTQARKAKLKDGATTHDVTINATMLPRANFAIATSEAAEGTTGTPAASPTQVTVMVTLDRLPLAESTLTVGIKDGGNARNFDFDLPMANRTLTFGTSDQQKSTTVLITTDAMFEDNEQFTLELQSSPGGGIIVGTLGEHTHTILDDDTQPTVTITTAANTTVVEGNTGTTPVAMTVALSAPSGKASKVSIGRAGTATEGQDHTYVSTQDINFAAVEDYTQAAPTAPVTVNVSGDEVYEVDQTVITSLVNAMNATIIGNPITLTIMNDDQSPTIDIMTMSQSVNEGDPPMGEPSSTFQVTYMMRITGLTEVALSFRLDLTGTAEVVSDYSTTPAPSSMGSNIFVNVSVNAPATPVASATTPVIFSIVSDNIRETVVMGDQRETIIMTLSTFTNCRAGTQNQTRTITINDMD